jgi:hypothetical protein
MKSFFAESLKCFSLLAIFLSVVGCQSVYQIKEGDVVIENKRARLVIGADGSAKSLILKSSGEELLDTREGRGAFSITPDRPFVNELKLVFPNCETTYFADCVSREGDCLIIGFEHLDYKAKVKVVEKDDYFIFEFAGFDISGSALARMHTSGPQVKSVRFLDLPMKECENFGQWLNVVWDDKTASAVVALEPFAWIGNEKRYDARHLYAQAHKDVKLDGVRSALVVSEGKAFLDCMDVMEKAENLPLGVESRRRDSLNRSIYSTGDVCPENVDKHIAQAKKGGFKMMLVYYTAVCEGAKNDKGYGGIGEYEISKKYSKGYESLREMLAKIKAAGITPGLHVLHTFIGFKSGYFTPEVDPRVNIKRHFTLARPLKEGDSEIYVQEDPSLSPTKETTRILVFGGEAMKYEGYTTQRPYKFTGVKRGHLDTKVKSHARGLIGGVLDVCEYLAQSCYIDQNSDLQDEIAEKIARIYNCGFEFMYFDGSEGVNVPQGLHVPNAQYRVWKKFDKKPLFCEGAAKGHFGWHMQSGANAFDVFEPEEFKKMVVRWPLYEAPIMQKDFTRVNFGWWRIYAPGKVPWKTPVRYTIGTQMDMFEFATSRAAAYDCPATLQVGCDWSTVPRIDDLMEVIRRWEDVREKKWLTGEMKERLKSPTQEHHLYINDKGEYELHDIEMLETPEGAKNLRGFMFERSGKTIVACWHTCGEEDVEIPFAKERRFKLAGLKYIETDLSLNEVKSAWKVARFVAN